MYVAVYGKLNWYKIIDSKYYKNIKSQAVNLTGLFKHLIVMLFMPGFEEVHIVEKI